MVQEGDLLWKPEESGQEKTKICQYMNWLKQNKNLEFHDYEAMYDWSVRELEEFWGSLWSYFEIGEPVKKENVLTNRQMPGAKWFPEQTLNYAGHCFKKMQKGEPAIIHETEIRDRASMSWEDLYSQTLRFKKVLESLGVKKGDRVAAYISNIPEAIVAFLATASLGAVWSSTSPDFGSQSVIDRFQQIEPKILIAVDGYRYGGKDYDRMETVNRIIESLPSLEKTIVVSHLSEQEIESTDKMSSWGGLMGKSGADAELTFESVPFDHPLYILFSSGTTGKPKPIVHGHGGILIEHLKALTFHTDLGEKDRFFWFTTTGWMMWNFLVSGLLTGSTLLLYDGNPGYPDKKRLWKFAEETSMSVFGTSASFLTGCMKDGLTPGETYDLSALKMIGSTGSPLPPEGFKWCYDAVKKDLIVASVSGGTDVCSAFVLGVPIKPVYAGVIQCRGLGAAVESFNDDGERVTDSIGELVLTEPFPSMPVFFWGDDDGSRYRGSYFDTFPDTWRHGDYIKIDDQGGCIIYGRSDATINRGGVRIGTSEIYRAVDTVDAVADSLIVDIHQKDSDGWVPLFVQLKSGLKLTDEMEKEIKSAVRYYCSPRHTPTEIIQVEDIPKTLNGKKLEIPVKKILTGTPVEQAVNLGSVGNPETLKVFEAYAEELKKSV